jgi:hypothetical protein
MFGIEGIIPGMPGMFGIEGIMPCMPGMFGIEGIIPGMLGMFGTGVGMGIGAAAPPLAPGRL